MLSSVNALFSRKLELSAQTPDASAPNSKALAYEAAMASFEGQEKSIRETSSKNKQNALRRKGIDGQFQRDPKSKEGEAQKDEEEIVFQ